jgi:hypothetical protein
VELRSGQRISFIVVVIKTSPKMLGMRLCTLKLDEEKSKFSVDLVQQNDFGPTFLHNLLRLVKANKFLHLLKETVINMI